MVRVAAAGVALASVTALAVAGVAERASVADSFTALGHLTDFQLEVTRLFFSLPASKDFCWRGSGPARAAFDRAAARDFADVRLFARRFGTDVLLARAAQIDAGFDTGTLAGMIATP